MIEAVFLDIDGVLTDGAVYVDASGNETKRILFDDFGCVFDELGDVFDELGDLFDELRLLFYEFR